MTGGTELMTVEDIAAALSRKVPSARELLRTKKIKSFKDGRRRFVRRADFEAYVTERLEAASDTEKDDDKKGGES